MEVRRTAPVKLIVPDERRDDLHESARQFLRCANRAAEFCWSDDSYTNCVTANTAPRDALYKELREETDLTANLVQEAIRRAVQATKGCVERWKQGKRMSQPEFTSWSMVYDKRSATFYRNRVLSRPSTGASSATSNFRQIVRRPTSDTFSRRTTSFERVHCNTTR